MPLGLNSIRQSPDHGPEDSADDLQGALCPSDARCQETSTARHLPPPSVKSREGYVIQPRPPRQARQIERSGTKVGMVGHRMQMRDFPGCRADGENLIQTDSALGDGTAPEASG